MSNPTQPISSLITPLQWALGMAIGLTCLGAVAQDAAAPTDAKDPYYIGAGIGWTHDSNVTRQRTNGSSDSWTSLSLLGGVNKTFGRQRVYLDGTVSDNRYQEFKSFNNTSYGLNTGVDWATIGNLSGNLRYGVTQNLANQALGGVSTGSRNVEKTQVAGASARYGITSRFALEGGLQHRTVDYSQALYAGLENTQNVANVGVVYGLSGVLTLGVGLRSSKTDTPQYSLAGGDKTDRNDVDFTTSWSPSGLSTINGRLSVGKEEHTRATSSNFSGVTGSVSWDYRPTGRLRFNTSLTRDTGAEARFIGFVGGSTVASTETYRLTTTAQGSATYIVTGKIDTQLSLSRARGTVVGNNTLSGSDTVTTLGLGGTYKATRSVALSCKLGRESRTTNSTLSSSYDANTIGCLANVTLR